MLEYLQPVKILKDVIKSYAAITIKDRGDNSKFKVLGPTKMSNGNELDNLVDILIPKGSIGFVKEFIIRQTEYLVQIHFPLGKNGKCIEGTRVYFYEPYQFTTKLTKEEKNFVKKEFLRQCSLHSIFWDQFKGDNFKLLAKVKRLFE